MVTLLLALAIAAQGISPGPESGKITGVIRTEDGKPASDVRVAARVFNPNADGSILALVSLSETDADGHFVLENIPPGRYQIVAGSVERPTFYPGTDSAEDAWVLEVARATTVDSVDFTVKQPPLPSAVRVGLSVPLGVSGKVTLEGGKELPRFLPHLYVDAGKGNRRSRFGEDGSRIQGSGTFGAVPVSRNGTFRLLLEDGDYDISLVTSLGEPLTADDDGYYVKSTVSGSVDLAKQKLSVRGGTAPSIAITLASGDEPPAK